MAIGGYRLHEMRRRDNWPLLCIVAVNVLMCVVAAIAPSMVQQWLALPNSPMQWLARPWSLLSYMFIQDNIWHLLFNMIVLWWFADVLLQTVRRGYITCLYIFGGLAGGLLFLLAGWLDVSSVRPSLIGSSAAVLSVVCAAAMRSPDYRLNLLLIGEVRIRWIALVIVLVSLIIKIDSVGGGLAHIGGILTGLAWGFGIRRHKDIFGFMMRPKGQRALRRDARKFKKNVKKAKSKTDELDRLLDKVRVSGYESLSQNEKERLRILSQDL